jgi:hypothetical protein
MDSNMEALLIGEMTSTEGWRIVRHWMESRMEGAKVRLLSINPIESPEEIIKYQGMVRNFSELLGYIDKQKK